MTQGSQEKRRYKKRGKGLRPKVLAEKQPVTIKSKPGSGEIASVLLGRFAAFHWPTLFLSPSVSGFHYRCYDALCSGQANACVTASLLFGC